MFWNEFGIQPGSFLLVIKRNPPAMPVDKGKTTKALAAARSRYTKKLLCAKLNVRLATVHK